MLDLLDLIAPLMAFIAPYQTYILSAFVILGVLYVGRNQVGSLYERFRQQLRRRLAGDSSTDAPPPDGKVKKKRKGK